MTKQELEESDLTKYFADRSGLITLDLISKDNIDKYDEIVKNRIKAEEYQNWGNDTNGNLMILDYGKKETSE